MHLWMSGEIQADVGNAHRAVRNAVEQAVIATDIEGQIIFWNRFAERLYGWRAEEVLGLSY